MIAAHPRSRANALPETALVVSLMLMLTLAAIDLATIGFGQAEADGAAFVGARTLAVANSTTSSVATNAIAGVFPKVNPNTVSVRVVPGTSYVGAEVVIPGQPIHLLNGVSSPSTQDGHTYETTLGVANPLTSTLSVVSDVPCAVVSLDGVVANKISVRLAQDSTSTTGGNGTNADFGEFSTHEKVYYQLSSSTLFPKDVLIATASLNFIADKASSSSVETTMTTWDTVGTTRYPAADQTCPILAH